MKKGKLILTFLLIALTYLLGFSFLSGSFAKDKTHIIPNCTTVGEISCPKGLRPTCPSQYMASCVFVGTMQLPGCLADSTDNTFLNYRLDKISCEKK